MTWLRVWGVLGLVACMGCPGGMSKPGGAASLVSSERSREVDVVYYTGGKGPNARGGTSPAKILIKPNPSKEIRVATFEEFSGGAGNMWRASVWMASFVAATTLGRTLTDYEFGVSAGGLIDGPSAGALTTAAMMAGILGEDVLPNVTMTGTVNPDGSVGPVGGIPQKIQGAAAKGKKVFGYPIGQRYDQDMKTGQLADLVSVGNDNKVEAKEVKDIYEAYTLLTGKTLPRPQPLEAKDLEVSPKLFQRMQAKAGAWAGKSEASAKRLKGNKGVTAQAMAGAVQTAANAYQRAGKYLQQGMIPIAYYRAAESSLFMDIVHRMDKMLVYLQKQDLEAIGLELEAMNSLEGDLNVFMTRLATEEPTTVGGAVALVSAYTSALSAYASIQVAKEQKGGFDRLIEALKSGKLRGKAAEQAGEQVLQFMNKTGLYYALASVQLEMGTDLYESNEATGAKLTLDPVALSRLARAYTSAAKANADYYDALVTEQVADAVGASIAKVREVKAATNDTYLFVRHKLNFALEHRDETKVSSSLACLGAAIGAYLGSAQLVSQEYSLQAKTDKEGTVVEVGRDKAFMAMLELAEVKTRESAALARLVANTVPTETLSCYQMGKAMREGDVSEKLEALDSFWEASAWSQLAVTLARLNKD